MLLLTLALLQAPVAPDTVPGTGAPAASIPRIEAAPTIDGRLDEPVWRRATRLTGFSQYQPVDGRPAEEATEVLVWYSPSAIYFGIIAHDRQPTGIRATHADRDNIDSDDNVTIYLDTFNDRRRAFFFAVNPLGVQQDGVRTEGSSSAGHMFGGSIDRNPDYIYDSRGMVTDSGYQVEVRIPFKSLRYPGSGPQTWGIQIDRITQRTGYEDTWTDARRANASFLIQAGVLTGLHDLHRGIVFEAQPFVTATANGARDTAGVFSRESLNPDAGINLRAGLTNLSLDATVNPDFSQVESDVGQVTVNQRFALFFPEKRPFFLEGIELFSTPNQLVYSRQIVNPIAGGKVTGKLGGFGLAHLTAVDQNVDGTTRDALFNVTRLRRDFGSNSTAGITFTDRSVLRSPDYNRVLAGDVRYVFGKLYYFEAQLGGAWTNDSAGYRSAPIWKLEYDRTGRSWGFNYQVNAIGRDFVSRAGFVPRNNIVSAHAFNRLSFYGARGALIESFSSFWQLSRIWRYGDIAGNAIEGNERVNLMTRWRNGWELNGTLSRDFWDFEPADYAGYQVNAPGGPASFVPPTGVSGPGATLQLNTPTFQQFDAGIQFGLSRAALFEEAGEGTQFDASLDLDLRPTSSVRITGSTVFQRLTRQSDGSEFARSIIPRLKLEYQPSRALFFRLVGEYRSDRQAALRDPRSGTILLINGAGSTPAETNALRLDALLSFEPSPGTVAFFGYGSSLSGPGTLSFRRLRREADGFFVKLAYQFRR